mgnify:CR=1 FL=1
MDHQDGAIEVANLVLLAGKKPLVGLDDTAVFLLVNIDLLLILPDSFIQIFLELVILFPQEVYLFIERLIPQQIRIISLF